MGKISQTYPQGHFRLYKTNRQKPDKPYVVQIEYTVNSIAVRRSTGISVFEKDWNPAENKRRGGIKPSYGRDYIQLNNRLVKLVETNDAKIAEFVEQKHRSALTVEIVRAILDKSPITRNDKGLDFRTYIESHLESERDKNRIGESTYQNGRSAIKIFSEFLLEKKLGTYKNDAIFLSEVNENIIEKYVRWRLKEKRNAPITVKFALKTILRGCEKASTDGYIPQPLNQKLQETKSLVPKGFNDQTNEEVRYLSEKQLNELLRYYKKETQVKRRECAEMFLFSLYACGLRFVDILTLQWSHIDLPNKTLDKVQVKTKNRNTIPLSEQAIKILEKWKGKNGCERFVFGLLPSDFDLNDTKSLYHLRNSRTRAVNYSLKVIGRAVKLPFRLTCHVARHTFAVLSLNNGMEMSMVSQLLGHSSTKMTERFLSG